MIKCFLLFGILITAAACAGATERFSMGIELSQAGKVIERGRVLVSGEQHTWSKGLQRSYLRLRCNELDSGKTKKLFSTVDHFSGLRVTHQSVGNNVDLTVVQTSVQPRLAEIRALARDECKELSPIVTTTRQTYRFAAEDGMHESRPFGEGMLFLVTLRSLGE